MSGNYFMKDLVLESFSSQMNVEWTEAVLYTPYQKHQALLYEYADGVAAQTFLKMADLPYKLLERPNAEFMSPTGKVPFLKLQQLLISEYMPIVDFIAKYGVSLSTGLSDTQQADLQAHIAIIEENLKNIELYIMWVNESVWSQVTFKRYGSVYLWPLNKVLPHLKKREIFNFLRAIGWDRKSPEWIMDSVDKIFKCLSSKLGTNNYFMGSSPTELDALAFGHLFTILTTELPYTELVNCLRRYSNLTDFCKRIDEKYFK